MEEIENELSLELFLLKRLNSAFKRQVIKIHSKARF